MHGSVCALTAEKSSGPKEAAFFELSCTRLSSPLSQAPSRVFLHARICIMYTFFMHGTFAFLGMESLVFAAQMTPASSWALAQIVLLGHEVP